MYKIIQLGTPPALASKITHVSNVHNRQTRIAAGNTPYPPRVNLELSKNNFMYCGISLWSSPPLNIKSAENIESFKAMLMSELMKGE